MQKTENIIQLGIGKTGVVVDIQDGHGLRRKVEALGIRVGCRITKISSHFWRGPITVRVNNSVIALGRGVASRIILEVK